MTTKKLTKLIALYMSRYEYGVLSLMARHPGQLFTKEQIFEAVWHQDSESCLTAVTNAIGRIRTLCGVCLCSFVESKAFKIAIVPSADRSMDTCTVCQTRRGHDYVVMKR